MLDLLATWDYAARAARVHVSSNVLDVPRHTICIAVSDVDVVINCTTCDWRRSWRWTA